ncbi:hypothetical protein OS493_007481 [Desmophyllum pertusum]|uniref:Uncharacterized protein n=1 Tax=Desmophyllum pertusum TaxID=174260 RepID=A0A9W9Z6Q6_9CNID|nr:hypothetical protein OS493_007481 [Desmophyllum pertusum]
MAVKAYDAEISKAKQSRKVATLLKNIGNTMQDSYLQLEFDRRTMTKTVEAWHRDLSNNLKNVSTPPKVSKSTFCDGRKLFGANLESKVTLRQPGHLGAYEEIVLLQFDPTSRRPRLFAVILPATTKILQQRHVENEICTSAQIIGKC